MAIEKINPAGLHEPEGYTHVVVAQATKRVYVSGQIGVDDVPSGLIVDSSPFTERGLGLWQVAGGSLHVAHGPTADIGFGCRMSGDAAWPSVRQTRLEETPATDPRRKVNLMPDTQSKPILVLGANGKTGRRVAERLTASGRAVRAASRSSETRFDWQDETTWAPALNGVEAVYITYYPDLAFPGAADTVGTFADLAVASGVKRLVLLSGRGEEAARQAEVRVENSGADWTLVRCAFFNQNFSEAFADAVRYGVLALPGGTTAEPFLDADDIADVVVAALSDDRHIGQLYELTGPRLLTFTEVAAELSTALGRGVEYQPVAPEEYASELVTYGLTEEEAVGVAELFAEVLDGRNSYLTDGVQRALGRPPRDFADFARDTAATGVWDLEVAPT